MPEFSHSGQRWSGMMQMSWISSCRSGIDEDLDVARRGDFGRNDGSGELKPSLDKVSLNINNLSIWQRSFAIFTALPCQQSSIVPRSYYQYLFPGGVPRSVWKMSFFSDC